jgi:hypothetical protein
VAASNAAQLLRQRKLTDALCDACGRAARCAALGGDDDDAVGALGAVDGARGGTLEDLDVLDVRRIEVRDAIDRLILAIGDAAAGAGQRVEAAVHCAIAHEHSVNHIERAGVRIDRRHAAELDLGSAAWRARIGGHHSTGNLALERVLDGWRWRLVQLLATHLRDGIGGVRAGHGRRRACHDLRLELQDVTLKANVGGLARRRNGLHGAPEAEPAHHEDQCSIGHTVEREPPVTGGVGADGGALDTHARRLDRFTGRSCHTTGDAPLCGGLRADTECQQQRQNQESELPHIASENDSYGRTGQECPATSDNRPRKITTRHIFAHRTKKLAVEHPPS